MGNGTECLNTTTLPCAGYSVKLTLLKENQLQYLDDNDRNRLYEVIDRSNVYYYEEIPDFRQPDLEEDRKYILETKDNVFLWYGKENPRKSFKTWRPITTTYLTKRPEATAHKPITVIKQGREPTDFHIVFPKWNPDMWLKQHFYESEREAVLRNNEIRDAK